MAHSPARHTRARRAHASGTARARPPAWTYTTILALLILLAPAWSPGNRAAAQSGCTSVTPPCPSNESPHITFGYAAASVSSPAFSVSIAASDDAALLPATLSVTTATGDTASKSVQYGTDSATMNGTVSLTLSPGTTTIIAWIQDSDHVEGSDTIVVTYTEPPPASPRDAPIVNATTHSNDVRDLACAGCTNATLAYTTPSYVSRDAAQALTLTYNSGRAVPRAYVQVEANLNTSTAPDSLSLALKRGSTFEVLTTGATAAPFAGGIGLSRLAAQVDVSSLGTGAYDDTAYVTAIWTSGTREEYPTRVPVRLLVINGATDATYGIGWGIAGLQRLYPTGAGSASFLLVDGSGVAVYFETCGPYCWTSPLGDHSVLSYDSGTQTYRRTFPDGTVSVFDNAGYLSRVKSRWNDSVTYAYTSGRLTSVTDAAGQVTTLAYGGDPGCTLGGATNTLCRITTPGSRTTQIKIDGSGHLVRIDDPDGRTALAATYDGSHRLTEWVGRMADTTTVTYDSFHQVASIVGPRVSTSDAGLVRPTTTISSLAVATLSSSTQGRARVVPESAFVRTTAPNGTAVTMRLHRSGNPLWTETRDVTGHRLVSTVTYDDSNRVRQITSPSGGATLYSWSESRLTSVARTAAGATQTMTYDAYDQVKDVHLNNELRQRFYYSGAKLAPDSVRAYSTDTTASAKNPVTRYTYDSHGRVLTVKDPEAHVQTVVYQSGGFQNTQSVTANGHTTSFSYDRYGRDSSVTNPLGEKVSTLYDAVNRPTSVTGPSATTVRRVYLDASRSDSLIDPINQTYVTVRNALGWVTSSEDPRHQTMSYAYDRLGRVTTFTNRRNQSITFSYDSLGRVLTQTAGTDSIVYSYDSAQEPRWMVVRNAESIDTLRFDAAGRPTDAIAVRNGVKYDVTRYYYGDGPLSGLWVRRLTASTWGKLLEPGYDTLGRVTKLPDFSGRLTAIGYNNDGFPTVDTLPTAFRMTATSLYTTGHRLWSTSYPQVATQSVSYSHDALERITSAWRGPSTDRENRLVTYDSLGRVTKYTDVRHWYEQYLVCDDPFVFTCDESEGHWEWAETESVDTLRSATYSYDKVGNRTDHSAVIGSGNRLTSFDGWTLTYDNDGNVTQKSKTGTTQTFTWNAFGQLTQVVVNGVTTTYGYDGLGRRVRKTVNGTTTRYLYDGDNLVVEMDANGAPLRWYSYYPGIDRPHAMVRQSDGARFYYLLEEPGHLAALVNSSESRVNRYTYDPFGQSIGTSETVPQAFRFAGREYDAETGLYFMRARYYDPTLGRFISEDPIGLAGGPNPYSYVDNDPLNFSDPFGLDKCKPGSPGLSIQMESGQWWCKPYALLDPWVVTPTDPPPTATPNFGDPCARGGNCTAEIARELSERLQREGYRWSESQATKTMDCSHFVCRALHSAGFKVPYVTTHQFALSACYSKIAPQDAHAGDVMYSPQGHVGIYTGRRNSAGQWLGIDWGGRMNSTPRGSTESKWGPGGWYELPITFYRPTC